MLIQPTLDALRTMKLHAMADALEQQRLNASLQGLPFEDRIAMVVDAEHLARDNRRLRRLLIRAHLKENAPPEDVNYRASRGLDRSQFQSLLNGDWVRQHQNLIVTGPTGVGKTWLVCALGLQVTRLGMPVLYQRFGRLLEAIEIARADGSLPKLRLNFVKLRLLILDDWGIGTLTARNRQDLLDVIDDCVGTCSVAIAAQLPVSAWHDYLGEPTVADAILDRLVHGAHRIELRGESLRKASTTK